MIIEEISDLKEAENLWRALSPNRTIFDEWGFRFCFYKHDPMPLCFLAAYEDSELIGLMPLEKHPEYGYEFFAEDPSEENRPFIKPGFEHIIPELYAAIPAPAKCYDILGDDSYTAGLPLEDYTYVLPLAGLGSFDDYFKSRLSPKKQRNFRAEFRKIEALNPEVSFDNFTDIDELFAINAASFDDSYLSSDKDRAGWGDLLALPYDWRIVSVKIDGKIVASSLSVMYNKTYFYLINGASDIPSLGKYLNKLNLERAIALGAETWNAGLGDCNWKESWHLDRVPQYLFKKI